MVSARRQHIAETMELGPFGLETGWEVAGPTRSSAV